MAEKRFVVVACEGEIQDIEIETLRPSQQLNVFGIFSIPFGIESEGEVKCKVKEIIIKDNGMEENELGELKLIGRIDEGKTFSELWVSEDLPKKVREKLGIGLFG